MIDHLASNSSSFSQSLQSLVRSLLNLMLSDERAENRLRAVYLLGQVAQALGTVREHDGLLHKAFNEVAKKILEIQGDEKKQVKNSSQSLQQY